jgi:hypothetical protein
VPAGGGWPPRRDALLARWCPLLTRATVARLHASAPLVVHVHDPLAWWAGHDQTVDLEPILRVAEGEGAEVALTTVARGIGPVESDPKEALRSSGIETRATALWHWPFSEGVDYLACATLAGEAARSTSSPSWSARSPTSRPPGRS